MFEIQNTQSFNTDRLNEGTEYDYVTRTSTKQGVLQTTGFINEKKINPAHTWSLGLLQMDFFYRKRPWYAGQFVRKIIPKITIPEKAILFFQTLLNRQKYKLLQVLVRNVDETFRNIRVSLPINDNGEIDFDFMGCFVHELEEQRMQELKELRNRKLRAYLLATGLTDYTLNPAEQAAINCLSNNDICFYKFKYKDIFNCIKQGRRLKKNDQKPGNLPFVMSGVTNTGVVGYVANPVAVFPANSITVDIFGNTFYRNYHYGAGDDTGCYWNDRKVYAKGQMLFFATAISKSLQGKYSYGNKLRSSHSHNFSMMLPTKNGAPDFKLMETLIVAVQKLIIKDVVLYADSRIAATKEIIDSKN